MSISAYIKVIGRGKDGARPLDSEQAQDLLGQVLDRQVTDLEIGAFCLAMRIKGETAEELQGFVAAALARSLDLSTLPAQAQALGLRGLVVLPSYNGARRLPNLTPLLAWALRQRGLGLLVHGPLTDPTRVTTAQIVDALGWPTAHGAEDVAQAWRAQLPAYLPIETWIPSLAALLAVRWTVGLRNPGHTVAKLLDPFAGQQQIPSVRVVNHTHPEYAHSLSDFLQRAQANALLMRGTEGEPVADARRQPRFDVYLRGERQASLSRAPVEGVLVELPELPTQSDAAATAPWIQSVIRGERPMPDSIRAQIDCLDAMVSQLA